MSLPRSFISLVVGVALGASFAAPLAADEVIPPRGFGRKFPTQTHCPLPVSIPFTPPGSAVVVFFDANVYIPGTGGNPTWTAQAIDNVSVATSAQVNANFGLPSATSPWSICYVDHDGGTEDPPASYFYFSNPGLTMDLFEQFDTDPTSRGWDMSHGAYFVDFASPLDRFTAPRFSGNATTDAGDDGSGSSLGLGRSGTPSLSEIATTSIEIDGLTPGTSYDLNAWWYAEFTVFSNIPTALTIRIETPNGTPIARKSWGGLKSKYR